MGRYFFNMRKISLESSLDSLMILWYVLATQLFANFALSSVDEESGKRRFGLGSSVCVCVWERERAVLLWRCDKELVPDACAVPCGYTTHREKMVYEGLKKHVDY